MTLFSYTDRLANENIDTRMQESEQKEKQNIEKTAAPVEQCTPPAGRTFTLDLASGKGSLVNDMA